MYIKRKIKFQNYKSCLEATQSEKKINYQRKIKITQIVLKISQTILKKQEINIKNTTKI